MGTAATNKGRVLILPLREIWVLYRCLDIPQTAGRGKIQDLFLTVDLTKGSFLEPSPLKSGERG
jgi:hypothetical protein